MDHVVATPAQFTSVHQALAHANSPKWAFDQAWSAHAWRFDVVDASWPTLYLEDISGIPFVDGVPGAEEYQHRARVRASTGDLFACVTPPAQGYELYCQDVLGMGSPELVLAASSHGPARVARACMEPDVLNRLVSIAQAGEGMVIHPYMGIEDVWVLARTIHEHAQVPVRVLAPTPHALWVANDKAALATLMRDIEAGDALVETFIEQDVPALVARIRQLQSRHEAVGIKRTRCASAMGNAVFLSTHLATLSDDDLTKEVQAFLESTEWPQGEDVLAVEWLLTDTSPSTQLWIPPLNEGKPSVEGIYEQLLIGKEKMFLGSRPSLLPARVHDELCDVSLRVAIAFQAMGYVGRCSFDFIVAEPQSDAPRVRMTECNGRWGGTSTPMSLVERLVEGPRPDYIAQDLMHAALVGRPFSSILDAVGDALFDPTTQQGHYLFYNVGPLLDKGKLDVIALGKTPQEAAERIVELKAILELGA